MQCSTAAFTARETRALRTWAALLFLACAQIWCGNLREHHRAWSRAHYPTSLASSFDTIPCSYANAIGGTHSTPNDGPVHNGSASPAAEELLRFVDETLFQRLHVVYVLRANSLRRAYQQAEQAERAVPLDHWNNLGVNPEPHALQLFVLLPSTHTRRTFSRQARAATAGTPFHIQWQADARATPGLSRWLIVAGYDPRVCAALDVIELPHSQVAARRLNVSRVVAATGAQALGGSRAEIQDLDQVRSAAGDKAAYKAGWPDWLWGQWDGWREWMSLAYQVMMHRSLDPREETGVPRAMVDADAVAERAANVCAGQALAPQALASICRCRLGATETNCFDRAATIGYLSLYFGSTQGRKPPITHDPFIYPATDYLQNRNVGSWAGWGARLQEYAACVLGRTRCSNLPPGRVLAGGARAFAMLNVAACCAVISLLVSVVLVLAWCARHLASMVRLLNVSCLPHCLLCAPLRGTEAHSAKAGSNRGVGAGDEEAGEHWKPGPEGPGGLVGVEWAMVAVAAALCFSCWVWSGFLWGWGWEWGAEGGHEGVLVEGSYVFPWGVCTGFCSLTAVSIRLRWTLGLQKSCIDADRDACPAARKRRKKELLFQLGGRVLIGCGFIMIASGWSIGKGAYLYPNRCVDQIEAATTLWALVGAMAVRALGRAHACGVFKLLGVSAACLLLSEWLSAALGGRDVC